MMGYRIMSRRINRTKRFRPKKQKSASLEVVLAYVGYYLKASKRLILSNMIVSILAIISVVLVSTVGAWLYYRIKPAIIRNINLVTAKVPIEVVNDRNMLFSRKRIDEIKHWTKNELVWPNVRSHGYFAAHNSNKFVYAFIQSTAPGDPRFKKGEIWLGSGVNSDNSQEAILSRSLAFSILKVEQANEKKLLTLIGSKFRIKLNRTAKEKTTSVEQVFVVRGISNEVGMTAYLPYVTVGRQDDWLAHRTNTLNKDNKKATSFFLPAARFYTTVEIDKKELSNMAERYKAHIGKGEKILETPPNQTYKIDISRIDAQTEAKLYQMDFPADFTIQTIVPRQSRKAYARINDIEQSVRLVSPDKNDKFWKAVLGRGYNSPQDLLKNANEVLVSNSFRRKNNINPDKPFKMWLNKAPLPLILKIVGYFNDDMAGTIEADVVCLPVLLSTLSFRPQLTKVSLAVLSTGEAEKILLNRKKYVKGKSLLRNHKELTLLLGSNLSNPPEFLPILPDGKGTISGYAEVKFSSIWLPYNKKKALEVIGGNNSLRSIVEFSFLDIPAYVSPIKGKGQNQTLMVGLFNKKDFKGNNCQWAHEFRNLRDDEVLVHSDFLASLKKITLGAQKFRVRTVSLDLISQVAVLPIESLDLLNVYLKTTSKAKRKTVQGPKRIILTCRSSSSYAKVVKMLDQVKINYLPDTRYRPSEIFVYVLTPAAGEKGLAKETIPFLKNEMNVIDAVSSIPLEASCDSTRLDSKLQLDFFPAKDKFNGNIAPLIFGRALKEKDEYDIIIGNDSVFRKIIKPEQLIGQKLNLTFVSEQKKEITLTVVVQGIREGREAAISRSLAQNVLLWQKGRQAWDNKRKAFYQPASRRKAAFAGYVECLIFVKDSHNIANTTKYLTRQNYDFDDPLARQESLRRAMMIISFMVALLIGSSVFSLFYVTMHSAISNIDKKFHEFVLLKLEGADDKFMRRFFRWQALVIGHITFTCGIILAFALLHGAGPYIKRVISFLDLTQIHLISREFLLVTAVAYIITIGAFLSAAKASYRKVKKINLAQALSEIG